MPPTDFIITPELSCKKVAFVDNGCDRNMRNKTVLKAHFTAIMPFLFSHAADRLLLTRTCSKTMASFWHGEECVRSFLLPMHCLESCVYTESITTLGTKMSPPADAFRASPCQTTPSDWHRHSVIPDLETFQESTPDEVTLEVQLVQCLV